LNQDSLEEKEPEEHKRRVVRDLEVGERNPNSSHCRKETIASQGVKSFLPVFL